jgi:microcystin-dependent protein
MANYEATRYDFDGANLTGIEGIPTGTITPWSQASAPTGFLECDGAAVSRSTYAALFAVISTTYGVGDGSTTFNVPDLTDKVAVHKSNTKNFASTGGANTVTPTGNVAGSTANATLSTDQLASHSHTIVSPTTPTLCGAQLKQTDIFPIIALLHPFQHLILALVRVTHTICQLTLLEMPIQYYNLF